MRTLNARCVRVCVLWARRDVSIDAVRTLCARCTLLANDIFRYVSRRPHSALVFFERCTNAVASPFGVTGALEINRAFLKIYAENTLLNTGDYLCSDVFGNMYELFPFYFSLVCIFGKPLSLSGSKLNK